MARKRISDVEDVILAHHISDHGLRVARRVGDEPKVRHYAGKRRTADTMARMIKYEVRQMARVMLG